MKTRIPVLFLLLFLPADFVSAQGNAVVYDFDRPTRSNSILHDSEGEGGFFLYYDDFFAGNYYQALMKVNATGDTLWTRQYPEFDTLRSPETIFAEDGNILVAATRGGVNFDTDLFAAKLSRETGEVMWDLTLPSLSPDEYMQQVISGENETFYILGGTLSIFEENMFVAKLSQDGELIWHHWIQEDFTVNPRAFTLNSDGDLTISAVRDEGLSKPNLYYVISSETGEVSSFLQISESNDYRMTITNIHQAGENIIEGVGFFQPNGDAGSSGIITLENDGTFIDFLEIDIDGNEIGRTTFLDEGGMIMWMSSGGVPRLLKYDAAYNLLWSRRYRDITPSDNSVAYDATPFVGGYSLTGVALNPGFFAFLVTTDADGNLWSNELSGSVQWDTDLSCDLLPEEDSLAGQRVRITDSERDYYRYTDAEGKYSILLDTGSYTVNVLPRNQLWGNCDDQEFTFEDFFSAVSRDLPLQTAEECALLSTSIHTNRLRRCQEATYVVNYSNQGTIDGEDVYIEVSIDPELEVLSSSPPWDSQSDNFLTYNIGTLEPFAAGGIVITVFTPCDGDVELGLTHCSQAEIFPQVPCFDSPGWSGASIEVRGECDNDETIYFEIENVGSAPMTSPLEFIVIEDEMILNIEPFDLNPGEVLPIDFAATGNTFITVAEQEPGHPGISFPLAAVEGCGGFNGQSTVTWYPQDDNDEFIDINCLENVDSYDPNDKSASPRGYGEEHFIEPNTDLTYLIRFQNEGNDTAYKVVIRDTLTGLLDINSLSPQGSSFPFDLGIRSLGSEHELTFTFTDINLLPKSWDEAASQGYVTFRVQQQVDLPLGTVIENRAGIYFDFNAPIITNTVFHTLGENFIEIISSTQSPGYFQYRPQVFPNPAEQTSLLQIKNYSGDGRADFFELQGKKVMTLPIQNGQTSLKKGKIPSGLYLLRLYNPENASIGTAKIVIKD